jgi:hypothetical protein
MHPGSLSKWQYLQLAKRRKVTGVQVKGVWRVGDDNHVFGQKFLGEKRACFPDATASSFVAKVTIPYHSEYGMHKYLPMWARVVLQVLFEPTVLGLTIYFSENAL